MELQALKIINKIKTKETEEIVIELNLDQTVHAVNYCIANIIYLYFSLKDGSDIPHVIHQLYEASLVCFDLNFKVIMEDDAETEIFSIERSSTIEEHWTKMYDLSDDIVKTVTVIEPMHQVSVECTFVSPQLEFELSQCQRTTQSIKLITLNAEKLTHSFLLEEIYSIFKAISSQSFNYYLRINCSSENLNPGDFKEAIKNCCKKVVLEYLNSMRVKVPMMETPVITYNTIAIEDEHDEIGEEKEIIDLDDVSDEDVDLPILSSQDCGIQCSSIDTIEFPDEILHESTTKVEKMANVLAACENWMEIHKDLFYFHEYDYDSNNAKFLKYKPKNGRAKELWESSQSSKEKSSQSYTEKKKTYFPKKRESTSTKTSSTSTKSLNLKTTEIDKMKPFDFFSFKIPKLSSSSSKDDFVTKDLIDRSNITLRKKSTSSFQSKTKYITDPQPSTSSTHSSTTSKYITDPQPSSSSAHNSTKSEYIIDPQPSTSFVEPSINYGYFESNHFLNSTLDNVNCDNSLSEYMESCEKENTTKKISYFGKNVLIDEIILSDDEQPDKEAKVNGCRKFFRNEDMRQKRLQTKRDATIQKSMPKKKQSKLAKCLENNPINKFLKQSDIEYIDINRSEKNRRLREANAKSIAAERKKSLNFLGLVAPVPETRSKMMVNKALENAKTQSNIDSIRNMKDFVGPVTPPPTFEPMVIDLISPKCNQSYDSHVNGVFKLDKTANIPRHSHVPLSRPRQSVNQRLNHSYEAENDTSDINFDL